LQKQANLFVLSGPSGVGKGTVLDRLLEDFKLIEYSVSATTRKPRPGEISGQDYFFLAEEEFLQMIREDRFIEWARVHNNYYGTPGEFVEKTLKAGKDIILEIDIQGARQVKRNYPDAIFIFLIPPSLEELRNRIEKRGSEDEINKDLRLKNAEGEMKELASYDYIIVNDQLTETVNKLKAIIIAEKCRLKGDELA
jgi:guanylate kinase